MEVIAVQNTGNGQLVTYKKKETSTESSEEEVEEQPVRPAGQPYLTKINGRLVIARDKKDKQINKGMDLLSHLFGGPEIVRVVKKHCKQPEQPRPQPPFLAHMTQGQPMLLNLSQTQPQISPPALQPIQQWHQQMQQSITPSQTLYNAELAQLRQAITDLQVNTNNSIARNNAPTTSDNLNSNQTSINTYSSTSMTITKHICVNCGRLRSRKYHHEHPIKPGEVPAPAFCARCQKDATSTDSSSSGRSRIRRKNDKKRKPRDKKRKAKEQEINSSNEDDSDVQKSKKIVRDKGLQRKQTSQKKRSYRRSEYIDDNFESDMESATSGIRKNGVVSRRREESPREEFYTQTRPAWDRRDEYIRNHRRPEEKIVYVRQKRNDSPSIEYRIGEERRHLPVEEKTLYVRRERNQPLGIQYQSEDKHYKPSTSELMRCRQTDKNKECQETIKTRYIEVVKESPRSRDQPPSRRNEYEFIETYNSPSRQHYKNETSRPVPYERQHSLDSNYSGISSHHNSSQRRRQERSQQRPGVFEQPPSNVVHKIHPQPGDEKVVVRETFVYRPRQSPEARDMDPHVKRSGQVDERYQAHELGQYSRPDSRYENHEYANSPRHKLHPQSGDNKVIGRETSVYRPQNFSRTRDNDIYTSAKKRGDEVHQAHHYIQRPKSMSGHEYGHEIEEIHHRERSRSRNMSRERHRQDDWDVAGTDHYSLSPDIKYADRRERHRHPPRVPSPPQSSSSSNTEITQLPGIYPDSVSGVSNDTIPSAYQAYNEARQRVPSRGREPVRSSSRHRQPHVQKATDGGTERALVPSPALRRPGEHAISNSPDNSEDGRREVEERHIEMVHERHVTFEEPSTSYEDDNVVIVEEERRSREPNRSREDDIIVVEEETSMLEREEDEHYDRHWEGPDNGGTKDGWGQHDGSGGGDGNDWGDSGGGDGGGGDGW